LKNRLPFLITWNALIREYKSLPQFFYSTDTLQMIFRTKSIQFKVKVFRGFLSEGCTNERNPLSAFYYTSLEVNNFKHRRIFGNLSLSLSFNLHQLSFQRKCINQSNNNLTHSRVVQFQFLIFTFLGWKFGKISPKCFFVAQTMSDSVTLERIFSPRRKGKSFEKFVKEKKLC